MLALDPDTQLKAYTGLRLLEARARAIEDQVSSLKQCCLVGRAGALTQLVASTSELRWQLRQLNEQAATLESIFGMSRNHDTTEKPPAPQEARYLRGTTAVLALPDLVNMLSSLLKTGTLTLQSGGSMFVFEFQNGSIVHAVTNHGSPDFRLGTILVAQCKITAEQLHESLEQSAEKKNLLGSQLLLSATVSAPDLRSALELQVRRIFEEAFALPDASFTFLDGSLSNIAQRVSLNTMQLLLEAARQKEQDQRERGAAVSTNSLDALLPG